LRSRLFFILDRVLKWLFANLWPDNSYGLVGDWLKLEFIPNQGMAFSIPAAYWLIVCLSILVILSVIAYSAVSWNKNGLLAKSGLALVVIGAVSNLLDRLQLGSVVDYIYLKGFSVFNLADAFIVIGLVVLLAGLPDRSSVGKDLD
jgi:signal peptidase II